MTRGPRHVLLVTAMATALLVAACSGEARTGGAPGPAIEDPVVPSATHGTSGQVTPSPTAPSTATAPVGPRNQDVAEPTSSTASPKNASPTKTTTVGERPAPAASQDRPAAPHTVGQPTGVPPVEPPPKLSPPSAAPQAPAPIPPVAPPPTTTSRKPSPPTRPGGAPKGAAVIDRVDSGADFAEYKSAQLEECGAEGRPDCWNFDLVGDADDRVCAVSPPPGTFVEYGETITITTKPVPPDSNCFDFEEERSVPTTSGS
jgi:hypothetical protein